MFFLIEVFYRGPHGFRLRWVFGLFTFASVLVSRIAIEEGHERASLFGLALAIATLIVTVTLVDFEYGSIAFLEPVVVIVFIAVVMWSTNRLTWDCTVIDDSRDVSSIGLTEFVKRKIFRKRDKQSPADSAASEVQFANPASEEPTNRPGKFLFLFFANAKNKNTPGLWVFYFALAAFPIFGFGQWFAQPSDHWGYRWIFFLFAVYLGSGLGLLMLTSLLGLERYLRKRGASLPGSVSRSWMLVGTCFALAIMFLMLLLPSPNFTNGLENALGFLTTRNNNTSEFAVGNDGQNKGDQPRGQKKQEKGNEGQKQKPGNQGDGEGGQGGKSKSGKSGNDSSGNQKSNKQQSSKTDQKKNSNQSDNSSPKNEPSNNQDRAGIRRTIPIRKTIQPTLTKKLTLKINPISSPHRNPTSVIATSKKPTRTTRQRQRMVNSDKRIRPNKIRRTNKIERDGIKVSGSPKINRPEPTPQVSPQGSRNFWPRQFGSSFTA